MIPDYMIPPPMTKEDKVRARQEYLEEGARLRGYHHGHGDGMKKGFVVGSTIWFTLGAVAGASIAVVARSLG